MSWFRAAIFLFLLGPASVFAQAGPPLLTDDPGTPGAGHWEINVAFTTEKRSAETSFETPLLDINYGVGEHWQLKFEIPWVLLDEKDGGLKNGLGSSLAGVKWRYLDEDKAGVAASIYPQILFNNPASSSARRGLVEKGTQILLPFEFAKNVGKIGAVLELGYVFSDVLEDELLYGFAINYHPLEPLELLAEIHATHTTSLQDVELLLNAGTRWKFSKICSLLFSAGTSLPGSTGDQLEFLSYLGIQFAF